MLSSYMLIWMICLFIHEHKAMYRYYAHKIVLFQTPSLISNPENKGLIEKIDTLERKNPNGMCRSRKCVDYQMIEFASLILGMKETSTV